MSVIRRNKLQPDRSRAAMWRAMRARRRFRPCEIAAETGASPDAVSAYLKCLGAAGIVGVVERCERPRGTLYQVLVDEGATAPRVTETGRRCVRGERRANIVRALRLMRAPVTAAELALWASTETVPVTAQRAMAVCADLAARGIVTVVGSRPRLFVLLPGRDPGGDL
jgi:hypothetical protein